MTTRQNENTEIDEAARTQLAQLRDHADNTGDAEGALLARQALGTALLGARRSREEARALCEPRIAMMQEAAAAMTVADWTLIEQVLRQHRAALVATRSDDALVARLSVIEHKAIRRATLLASGVVVP
jgi:hypothetical protein